MLGQVRVEVEVRRGWGRRLLQKFAIRLHRIITLIISHFCAVVPLQFRNHLPAQLLVCRASMCVKRTASLSIL